MNASRRMQVCLALAVLALATACAPATDPTQVAGLVDVDVMKTYRVEDEDGLLSLVVKDVVVKGQTGEIDYLMVEPEPSGYDLDPRTAPAVAGETVPIPWKVVRVDSERRRLVLTVNAEDVLNAPRALRPSWPASRSLWTAVEQYWKSIPEDG